MRSSSAKEVEDAKRSLAATVSKLSAAETTVVELREELTTEKRVSAAAKQKLAALEQTTGGTEAKISSMEKKITELTTAHVSADEKLKASLRSRVGGMLKCPTREVRSKSSKICDGR